MNKIAIITGASSGIGRQIAIQLTKESYTCILTGRNETKLTSVQQECSGSIYYVVNLEEPDQITDFAKHLIDKYPSNDNHFALINNAGIVERNDFEETSYESWLRQFQTNIIGPALLTKELIPLLKKQNSSRIINISSTLGIKPIFSTSAYSASKAAMNNWTQSLALELAKYKITANCICPGIVETPIQSFYNTNDQKLREELNQMQPLNRFGQPQDIANLVSYLIKPETDWITGAIIPVDGGILLG